VLQEVLRHFGSAINFSVNYTLAKKFLQLKHLFCAVLYVLYSGVYQLHPTIYTKTV